MANEVNLIRPEDLTPEQRSENASKAGKASAEARRKKKSMKTIMDFLLSMPANSAADYNMLVDAGIDLSMFEEDEISNMIIVNAALLKNAKHVWKST